MTTSNGDFAIRLAASNGDTFTDAVSDDVVMCAYDGPTTRSFLTGFASSTTSSNLAYSVVRITSNAMTVQGTVFASNIGIGTSNPVAALDVAGDANFRSNVFMSGFSNVGGSTFCSSLASTYILSQSYSNVGNAYVGGSMTVGSNLAVNGTFIVNTIKYVSSNVSNLSVYSTQAVASNLTVSGNFSNGGNMYSPGASNVNGTSYTTSLVNMGMMSVGGTLTAIGGFIAPGFCNIGGATMTSNLMTVNLSTQTLSNTGQMYLAGNMYVQGGMTIGGTTYSSNLITSNLSTSTWSNAGSAYVGGTLTALNGLYGSSFSNVAGMTYASNLATISITSQGLSNNGSLSVAGLLTVQGGIYGVNFACSGGNTIMSNVTASNIVSQGLSNIGSVFVGGSIYAACNIISNNFSNISGNTYASNIVAISITTSNLTCTGSATLTGLVTTVGGLSCTGFSNVGGNTYSSNLIASIVSSQILSNVGNMSIGGMLTVGSNLVVNGLLNVFNLETVYSNITVYASETITSNLTVGGYLSNAGNFFFSGTSNINGNLFTGTHSNSGSMSVGGALTIGSLNINSNIVIDSNANATFNTLSASTLTAGYMSAGNMGVFRNRIINGDMRIEQRGFAGVAHAIITSGVSTPWFADRFFLSLTGSGSITLQQVIFPTTIYSSSSTYASFAALSAAAGGAFMNYMSATVSSTNTTLSSTDVVSITQRIEGLNVTDLAWGTPNAIPVIVSFFVQSSIAGTYSASLRGIPINGSLSQSVVASFTVSSSSTSVWKRIVLSFPGNTTSGWPTDVTCAITLDISMLAGSSFCTSAANSSVWQSGSYTGISGMSTSFMGSVGNTFNITGVQLEKGTIVTPFEFRPILVELQLCQRYFCGMMATTVSQRMTPCFGFSTSNIGSVYGNIPFCIPMRAAPVLVSTFGSNFNGSNGMGIQNFSIIPSSILTSTSDTTSTNGVFSASITTFVGSNLPSNFGAFISSTVSGQSLQWSSEL